MIEKAINYMAAFSMGCGCLVIARLTYYILIEGTWK
jgi:hypothetical protein